MVALARLDPKLDTLLRRLSLEPHEAEAEDGGWLYGIELGHDMLHIVAMAHSRPADEDEDEDAFPGGVRLCGTFMSLDKLQQQQQQQQQQRQGWPEGFYVCAIGRDADLHWFRCAQQQQLVACELSLEMVSASSDVVLLWSQWERHVCWPTSRTAYELSQELAASLPAQVAALQLADSVLAPDALPDTPCAQLLRGSQERRPGPTKANKGKSRGKVVQACCDATQLHHPFSSVFESQVVPLRLLLDDVSGDDGVGSAPVLHFDKDNRSMLLSAEALLFVRRDMSLSSAFPSLVAVLQRQIGRVLGRLLHESGADFACNKMLASYFMPPHLACPIAVGNAVACSGGSVGGEERRAALHRRFALPLDRRLLDASMSLRFHASAEAAAGARLYNVHRAVPPSGLKNATTHLVKGAYAYYHYMQDHFNDDGWGCAYRSLQTLWSWLRLQNYTSEPIPSHRTIQELLVEHDDKPSKLIGSKQWIGALELSTILQTIGISSRILHLSSGKEFSSRGRELAHHFDTHGSPVMIGGGVLAYTLLGVEFDEVSGDVRFLILDPHFTGAEEIEQIVGRGWCGWKTADLFEATAFYNLCMPQRPGLGSPQRL